MKITAKGKYENNGQIKICKWHFVDVSVTPATIINNCYVLIMVTGLPKRLQNVVVTKP